MIVQNQSAPAAGIGGHPGEYYELRLYELVPGRLHGFNHLMEVDAPPLFARYGLKPLVLWNGFAGPILPLYGYLLRWTNLDERMAAWNAFYSDPDWLKAASKSYNGQQRVERANIFFMRRSALFGHPVGTIDVNPAPAFHELRLQTCDDENPIARREGDSGERHIFDKHVFERHILEKHGATMLGVFRTLIGTKISTLVKLIAWPDMEHRNGALAELCRQTGTEAKSLETGHHTMLDRYDAHLIQPRAWPALASA